MNLFDIIGRLLGIVPAAVDAGKTIADAVKPSVVINPLDAELWHTVTYAIKGHPFCVVCQKEIPLGLATELCSEAVRRRNAGLS